jgi:hypothetical protein
MKRNLQRQVEANLLFGASPESALSLVDGLNEMEDRATAELLGQLILDFIDLSRMAKDKEYVDNRGRFVGSKLRALWEKIRFQLGSVRWTPYLFPPSEKRGLVYLWAPAAQAPRELDTSQYAGIIFNLAARGGMLEKVRRCRNCKKWFFASRGIHRFCSVNCRVAFYRKTPQGRARNREYMRNYRDSPFKREEGRRDKAIRRKRR